MPCTVSKGGFLIEKSGSISPSMPLTVAAFFARGVCDIHKLDRGQPLSRDGEIENVEPIVIANHSMELFRLNALRDVNVLIQQAFGLAQRVADHIARRPEEHRHR